MFAIQASCPFPAQSPVGSDRTRLVVSRPSMLNVRAREHSASRNSIWWSTRILHANALDHADLDHIHRLDGRTADE
eukprot:1690868-Pleurochrysis_carterae.AAC.5